MTEEERPSSIAADFSEEEIARRRDEVVRRMLNTPYAPQKPKGEGKASKPKKKKKAPAKA
ncbi:MAG: hypothetical protein NVV62_04235 [Terricaulis sp.]|nr:hypothetical protein [Terricaulis sp.]